VGPRAGLDDVEKRKFLTLPGLKLRPPRSSSLQPVSILTTLSWILYSGRTENNTSGAGFLVINKYNHEVIIYEPVNDSLRVYQQ
jgi:hypothetical protein